MNPLALEWASTLLALIPQMLGDAYFACGLPCLATTANHLQLSAPFLDLLYQFPAGTTATILRDAGLTIRGM